MPDYERAVPGESGLQRKPLRIKDSAAHTLWGDYSLRRWIGTAQKISQVNITSILFNHSIAVIGGYERLHCSLHHNNPIVR